MSDRDKDRLQSESDRRPQQKSAAEVTPSGPSGMRFLRSAGNQSVQRLLAPTADRNAESSARPVRGTSAPRIQRQPVAGAESSPSASPAAASGPAAAAAAPTWIVEDTVQDLAPGQMRRSEFLAMLRSAACSTAEEALSGTLWSTIGCPWIDYWLAHYGGKSAAHIERAVRGFAPGAAAVTSAQGYIPILQSRLRSAISSWRDTGEVGDLPSIPDAAGTPSAESGGDSEGGIFGKGADAAALAQADPAAVREGLGAGRPLDAGMGSQFREAFGEDLSQVRIHTDRGAASAAAQLGARAFTVGEHVAFGQGEYQPGTLTGDALIAHELAHVLQQQGSGSQMSAKSQASSTAGSLEDDADLAAVTVVGSLWGKLGRQPLPRLRSAMGLSLQRCTLDKKKTTPTLKDTLRKMLGGTPTRDAVVAAIHAAKTTERQAALKDSGLMSLIRSKFSGDDATVVMSSLLEGSFKWKNPPGNFFHDYYAKNKKTGTIPNKETMNCWESIMYAALLAGEIKETWIEKFYKTAEATSDISGTIWTQMGFKTSLPTNPPNDPSAGQLIFYVPAGRTRPSHVLLAISKNEGMSLWSKPNNKDFVQRIKLSDLSGTRYISKAPWKP